MPLLRSRASVSPIEADPRTVAAGTSSFWDATLVKRLDLANMLQAWIEGSNRWLGFNGTWPFYALFWLVMPTLTVGIRAGRILCFISNAAAITIATLWPRAMSDRLWRGTTLGNQGPIPATILQLESGLSQGAAFRLRRTTSIIFVKRYIRPFELADTGCGGPASLRREGPVQFQTETDRARRSLHSVAAFSNETDHPPFIKAGALRDRRSRKQC